MAGSRKTFLLEAPASRDMTKCFSELMFWVKSLSAPLLLLSFRWESGFLGKYSLIHSWAFCFRWNWEIMFKAFAGLRWGWPGYHSDLLCETVMSTMLSVIWVGMYMSAKSWSLTEEAEDELDFCWRLHTTPFLYQHLVLGSAKHRWLHELHCLTAQKIIRTFSKSANSSYRT